MCTEPSKEIWYDVCNATKDLAKFSEISIIDHPWMHINATWLPIFNPKVQKVTIPKWKVTNSTQGCSGWDRCLVSHINTLHICNTTCQCYIAGEYAGRPRTASLTGMLWTSESNDQARIRTQSYFNKQFCISELRDHTVMHSSSGAVNLYTWQVKYANRINNLFCKRKLYTKY